MSVDSVLMQGAPATTGRPSSTGVDDVGQPAQKIDLPFRTETWSFWNQVDDLLSAPFKTSIESAAEAEPLATRPGRARVVVAPGIAVDAEEYEIRYGQLDLEGLRSNIAPELYQAFVRHIGVIHGWEDLDVASVAEIPE